ncbi:hypothetical protein FIBSPDRAFT_915040 [Athelia psychrophila]|uniref:CxC2-like cysteine cluster KDZ transposase-associated domain-containing protein n=1 Tax=Athelia psychrophila TaxID=1759441 RepID=A0A167V5A5_9AGAM|nr:hypothetical protein FIBSPDRAFT_915040 [Fibularhizoctonia sp. CBS 109695]
MSGNWCWDQADKIAEDKETHGAMFVPIIMGSDKTTVSVATGQNEYYPLYVSLGNVHNSVLIGFLSMPKTDREFKDDPEFRKFRRQLFHSSIAQILQPLLPGMTVPELVRCPDGHFRCVVYGLGPYIADYPEQALLACIVQGWCPRCTARPDDLDGAGGRRSHDHTDNLAAVLSLKALWEDYGIVGDIQPFTTGFPRADIHELLSPDLLHQVIKGTFKDHLVMWVGDYLVHEHGPAGAAKIMADIDRRIAIVPPFPGLRRFPEGRRFKQWTGDDSKALMKVYLPAISGHVPPQMVRALSAFLDFCYLVRRDVIDEATLDDIDDALSRFQRDRVAFGDVRARGFSLPRQHSLSMHIRAVKEPYRRSSHFQALGQMLLTNQRLDKLAACRTDFFERGMLVGWYRVSPSTCLK